MPDSLADHPADPSHFGGGVVTPNQQNLDDDAAVEAAITVVARHAIAGLVQNAIEWEFYPEIGEADWRRVDDRMQQLGAFPDRADFDAAYALLASRAEHTC